MTKLQLRIITPRKIVREEEVKSVTLPASDGEVTILPRHTRLFSLLKEGIITVRTEKAEDFLAIGGGYLETDGKTLTVLVSRAYGQSEINEKLTQEAMERAQKILTVSKDEKEIHEANLLLRRSLVDLKLFRKKRKPSLQ